MTIKKVSDLDNEFTQFQQESSQHRAEVNERLNKVSTELRTLKQELGAVRSDLSEIMKVNMSNHHGADHRMWKLKMPLFDGEDSHGWIYKVERFQLSQEGTLYEQFLAITQEGSAREYVNLFEALAGQLVGIPEEVMKGTFIKGLRPELRTTVRVMQLEGLNHAMKLAMIIDENKTHSSSQVAVPSKGQTTIKGEYFRKMTESELKERRAKGLCLCEEKFKSGHQCAPHTLQVMIIDDIDEENEPYLQVKPWDRALKAD
ncbi:hypothetical protein Tco_0637070 [Tanacetum coccineum]